MNFNNIIIYLAVATLMFFTACKSGIKATKTEPVFTETIVLDTLLVEDKRPVYNPSEKRVNDLIHTKIDISFNWKKQWAYGKANLILKPHFYETDSLQLDAKGFELKEVALVKNGEKQKLDYTYDDSFINIELDKTYNRNEQYEIFIDYIAKPNELEVGGSAAITEDKGLYFINPLEEEKGKPRQLWTQGETEASSCWFPTIDSPNERTSQEMLITVEDKFKTISNGKLIKSTKNEDGTRTDYWKQEIPHAPYLFMMAIGPFSEVKDSWKDIETNYYVDKDYEPHAKQIFENTGEILAFYSEKFGMEYPWDKYNQVVVHDFVSGAMENTGAVIYYDALHQTKRDMLDGKLEDIIAHEAAHHWFGDYVTCESWANLPLNEAFATWAEIIWEEHKYGQDRAELKIQRDRLSYFDEAESKEEPLIRYNYSDKEDMFDRHSYEKGGQVMWMLQHYLGDEAFYAGIKKYLEDNALQSVEIHNLRIAMEAVSGEDLNWFFNQWFLTKGHPELKVESKYDTELSEIIVSVEQQQKSQLFRLPLKVALHFDGNIETKEIVIDKKENTFVFKVLTEPNLIQFDPDNILLAKIEEQKPIEACLYQYNNTKGYLNHSYAINQLIDNYPDAPETKALCVKALDNPFWAIRELAIKNIDVEDEYYDLSNIKTKFLEMAEKDDKTLVRGTAISKLSNKVFEITGDDIEKYASDSSYLVIASTIYALNKVDPKMALNTAEGLTSEKNMRVSTAVASTLSNSSDKKYNDFFIDYCDNSSGYMRYSAIRNYGAYLKNITDDKTIIEASGYLKTCAQNEKKKWLRYYAAESIFNKRNELIKQKNELSSDSGASKAKGGLSIKKIDSLVNKLEAYLDQIKSKETDKTILSYYNQFTAK